MPGYSNNFEKVEISTTDEEREERRRGNQM